MKKLRAAMLACGLLWAGVVPARAQPSYVFTSLDVPGSIRTEAHGINAAGQVVGEYFAGNQDHGYLWSGGTYTTLDVSGLPTWAPGSAWAN